MSTPLAQQRALSPLPPKIVEEPIPSAFAQWLAEGKRDVRGSIQQPNNPGRFAFVKPRDFPEERLYFSFQEWPESMLRNVRKGSVQGRQVVFDVAPQDWSPQHSPQASNVRLA